MEDLCLKSILGLVADNNKPYFGGNKNHVETKNIFERYLESQQPSETNTTLRNKSQLQSVKISKRGRVCGSRRNHAKNKRRNRVFISLESYTPRTDLPVDVLSESNFCVQNEEDKLRIRLLGLNSIRPIGINKTLAHILHENEQLKEKLEQAQQEEGIFQERLAMAREQQQEQQQQTQQIHTRIHQSGDPVNEDAEISPALGVSDGDINIDMNVDLDEGIAEASNDTYDFDDGEVVDENDESDFEQHEYSRVYMSSDLHDDEILSGRVLGSNPDLTFELESFSRVPAHQVENINPHDLESEFPLPRGEQLHE